MLQVADDMSMGMAMQQAEGGLDRQIDGQTDREGRKEIIYLILNETRF